MSEHQDILWLEFGPMGEVESASNEELPNHNPYVKLSQLETVQTTIAAARHNFLTMQNSAANFAKKLKDTEEKLSIVRELAKEDADEYTVSLKEEQERFAKLSEFIYRWTWVKENDTVSDTEKLDLIRHHPFILNLKETKDGLGS